METKIYYFSGAGNSLGLAKALKNALSMDTELMRMVDYRYEEDMEVNAGIMGFVFPVYFLSVPTIVKEFIKKIKIKGNPYIFGVAACNARPGHSLFTIDKLLMEKGHRLSAGYTVQMPGVSIVDGFLTSAEVNIQRLEKSKSKILEIAAAINKKVPTAPEGDNSIKSHFTGRLMTLLAGQILNPKLFYTTDRCSGCNICKRICPVENINMSSDQKPLWGRKCLHCMACLHWCPQKAVELGRHSQEKARFQHPEAGLDEMLNTTH